MSFRLNASHGGLPLLLLGMLLAGCGGGNTPDTPVAGKPLELTIAHVNDVHSNLDSFNRTLSLMQPDGKRTDVTVDAGGFARVTTEIKAIRAAHPHVLALHAGDALTGTLYFNRAGAYGEADAALMNTVCFDAFTLGNHEFDKGDEVLKNFIGFLHKDKCQTPVLSANVRFGTGSALHPSLAPGLVQPYTTVERDGQRIGIVGLTVSGKTRESSSPDKSDTFEDETLAAQRAIDALRQQGVNKIVLLSHIGYDNDLQIVPRLSGVDVVVGGDSHTLLGTTSMKNYKVGTPAGVYPAVLRNKDGKTVCLAHGHEYAKAVGELNVSFDAGGDVIACGGTPHVLIGNDYRNIGVLGADGKPQKDAKGNPVYRTATAEDVTSFDKDVADSGFLTFIAADAAAQSVLAPFKDKVKVYEVKQVANAPVEICSRRVPGGAGSADYSRSSADCNALTTSPNVTANGGDIQQMVTQAYLDVAHTDYGGADIALQSGGGARIPLKGTVTAADVIKVLPFGNMLWRMQITGAEAKAMIEDGLEATFKTDGSTGPYPYTAGLRFDVNAKAPKGSRASNFQVFDRAMNQWVALDAAKAYRLMVLSFNATGGDGYITLAGVPKNRVQDIGMLDADVFQAWIERQTKGPDGLPIIRKLSDGQYSTQKYTGP